MTVYGPVNPSEDTLDSRDIISRIDELKGEWTNGTEGDNPDDYSLSEDDWSVGLGEEGAAEIVALLELDAEGKSNIADWEHGATLIRDSYFTEYAKELASDLGAIDEASRWPACHIDWDAAADALKMDYSSVEFSGVTYWGRA